jgi:hypothetical protein
MYSAYRSNEDYSGRKESVKNHCGKDHLKDWSGRITFR